jgi:hypothetical protein
MGVRVRPLIQRSRLDVKPHGVYVNRIENQPSRHSIERHEGWLYS